MLSHKVPPALFSHSYPFLYTTILSFHFLNIVAKNISLPIHKILYSVEELFKYYPHSILFFCQSPIFYFLSSPFSHFGFYLYPNFISLDCTFLISSRFNLPFSTMPTLIFFYSTSISFIKHTPICSAFSLSNHTFTFPFHQFFIFLANGAFCRFSSFCFFRFGHCTSLLKLPNMPLNALLFP
jgi:hypothetical protein